MPAFSRAAAARLAEDLTSRISGEVRFDDGSRALYATDASNYRMPPIGVVVPKTIDDVVETVALARRHAAPILSRGGGTSLAGQTCNTAVVIDFSKYLNHIIDIDARAGRAWVEPGVILDTLRDAAERHHLTFGPDPSTHDHNTLGGMIGNNSCGVHSIMAGRTSDNVEQLEILTYDGLRMWVGPTGEEAYRRILAEGGRKADIYRRLKDLVERNDTLIRLRFPDIPRRVSGFALEQLLPEQGFNVARALVGSEGTCVTVLQAALRLVPSPPHRALVVLGYPDIYQAADHVVEIRGFGCIGLEGIDDILIADMRKKHMHPEDLAILPEGAGFLLVEFGGDCPEAAQAQARAMMAALASASAAPSMKLMDDAAESRRLWQVREAGLGATARIPGKADAWEGWEDAAVPPEKLGRYLRDFRALLDRYGYSTSLYGHFGDGCVHCRIDFDLRSQPGIAKWRRFLDEAADLVVRLGGSLSGEHGDGQSKAELLPRMYGAELVEAFREFKAVWDPENRMNPGKVVDPHPITADLRLGPAYPQREPSPVLAYQHDDGLFSRAVLRCVGVGKCRRLDGGVMCPSFMATREEQYSTRGRARLLFEMIHGDIITDGWRSEAVRQALDLCLSCKGCKVDCPVGVDMAAYKAEFLSHYYQGRRRPRAAYSMGLIHWWARAAAWAPRLANALVRAPALDRLLKAAGGVAPERTIPAFADQTFQSLMRRRHPAAGDNPSVVLWPDTFNNAYHPETALAAVEVLQAAGYRVVVPDQPLCCGRPLFAWGMLETARKQLAAAMRAVMPAIDRGAAMVVLEPACLASFRDELTELFPRDQTARRLASRSFLLSEFLVGEARWQPPGRLDGKALVHLHCHHHALFGAKSEQALLERLGLACHVLDSGCCGMAGSFGFEREHYPLSIAVGERALLPAVRAAAADTVIVANGYSCREQIAQATGRRAVHSAELAARSL